MLQHLLLASFPSMARVRLLTITLIDVVGDYTVIWTLTGRRCSLVKGSRRIGKGMETETTMRGRQKSGRLAVAG